MLSRDNSALVGVGKTISFLMPLTTGLVSQAGPEANGTDMPLLDVTGKSVTVVSLLLPI